MRNAIEGNHLKSDKKLKKHKIVCTREFNRSINSTIHSLTGKSSCKTSFSLQGLLLRTAPIFRALLQQWSRVTSQNKDRGAVCLPLLGGNFSFHVMYLSQGHGRSQPASQLRARKHNGIV